LTDTITAGTYTDLVTTTSGNGSGAILTVVASIVDSDVSTIPEITSVTVTTAGTGYAVGDTLTVTAATLAATDRSTDLVFTLIANNLNEQATENCTITTDFADLPDKKIVFSGN
jgi:precorrin-6B methylase 1